MEIKMHGTTVICIVKGNSVAMGSDGQVTLGNTIMKATAKKAKEFSKKVKSLELV